jgi:tetratricopeptide (TPR) repeat protein
MPGFLPDYQRWKDLILYSSVYNTLLDQGRWHESRGNTDVAMDLYQTAVQAALKSLSIERHHYFPHGDQVKKNEDEVQSVIKEFRTESELISRLSAGFRSRGEPARAIEYWKKFAESPIALKAQTVLAESFHAKGDPDSELKVWQKLVEEYPNDQSLQEKLSSTYEAMGGLDATAEINYWRTLILKHPVELSLRIKLAEAYEHRGNNAQGVAFCKS